LTKDELAKEAAQMADITKADALRAADAFFQAIQAALAKGEKVQAVGFGTFETQHRAARKGRNPQKPEEEIDIPAKDVAVFRAGKSLKEAVNAPEPKAKKKK
jgi:DNA-binding protein HU-beta